MSAAITPREANIFACLTETVVAPGGGLPPLARTDAVSFFGTLLERSPRLNRLGLRGILYALEVGPLARGFSTRFRSLAPAQRVRYLAELKRGGGVPGRLVQAVAAVGKLAYYGDDGVMRALGYDADAVVARGRTVRDAEGRW